MLSTTRRRPNKPPLSERYFDKRSRYDNFALACGEPRRVEAAPTGNDFCYFVWERLLATKRAMNDLPIKRFLMGSFLHFDLSVFLL